MSGHNPRVPDSTRKKIIELVKNSPRLYTDIAEEFGVSKYFVSKLAREHGFKRKRSRPRKPMSVETEQAIADEFLTDDLTVEQIGEKYGRSKRTVTIIVKRLRPEIDLFERGRRMARRTRIKQSNGDPSNPKRVRASRYQSARTRNAREERKRLERCPREQRVQQSKQAISGPDADYRIGGWLSWNTVGMILEARHEAGEEELRGSFHEKAVRESARKALDKLRTALEQYEYADDTPNRNGDHLRETMP